MRAEGACARRAVRCRARPPLHHQSTELAPSPNLPMPAETCHPHGLRWPGLRQGRGQAARPGAEGMHGTFAVTDAPQPSSHLCGGGVHSRFERSFLPGRGCASPPGQWPAGCLRFPPPLTQPSTPSFLSAPPRRTLPAPAWRASWAQTRASQTISMPAQGGAPGPSCPLTGGSSTGVARWCCGQRPRG